MATTRIVPDHVWDQLDASAGKLSPRERRRGVALIVVVAIALGVGVIAYFSGVAYPRIAGDMVAARGTPKTHELDVRVRLDNTGWVDQHVSALTVDSPSMTVIAIRPSSLVLPPGDARTVRMRLHVMHCGAVTANDLLPVAVVVHRWWGHESRVLFSDQGNSGYVGVARLACQGG